MNHKKTVSTRQKSSTKQGGMEQRSEEAFCVQGFAEGAANCELDLQARLALVIGENVAAFSRKSGVGESLLRQYLAGSVPGLNKAVAIARAGGVCLDWLATGQGPMRAEEGLRDDPGAYCVDREGDFARVPSHDLSASMGGAAVEDQATDYVAFRRSWLSREGLQPDKLVLIQAQGDSMSPAIESGDLLLVDLRQKQVAGDGIYVLSINHFVMVKRLQRMLDGGVNVRSDNPLYATQTLQPDRLQELWIIGRVVWVSRRI